VHAAVWDSSIVVAKYLEKLGPDALGGKRCLDLSAGCGLVGESTGARVHR
jgi:predicted nicotinamide N-methyase